MQAANNYTLNLHNDNKYDRLKGIKSGGVCEVVNEIVQKEIQKAFIPGFSFLVS